MKKKLSALLLAFTMLCTLAACGNTPSKESAPPVESGASGTGVGVGEGTGFGGSIQVEVTLSSDKSAIEKIQLLENNETESIGGKAIALLTDAILQGQTLKLDAVSGATLSSEGFLTAVTAALEAAGGNVAAFQTAPEPTQPSEQTLETDVVVVGAGGAGMVAAISAAQAGSRVILLEKTAMVGGNSLQSTGGMNAAKTRWQDENGWLEAAGLESTLSSAAEAYPQLSDLVETVRKQYEDWQAAGSEGYFDSEDLLILDTMIGGKCRNDLELVTTLARNSADALDWLDGIGASLHSVGAFGGASVRRIHRPVVDNKISAVGPYLVPILEQFCIDNGIRTILNAPVTELLVTDGQVCGVKAEGYTVNAKSVVLATGGFGANLELVTSLAPSLKGFVSTNAPGCTGDGILMAQSVGAATVDMDQIQIHPTVEKKTFALITEGLRGDGAILVNAQGMRFCNEVATRDVVSTAELGQLGGSAWLILDQKMAEASSVISGYIENGYTLQGSTYAQLAKTMGVPEDALTDTMNKWNAYVLAGQDPDFGRTSFSAPLDAPPFYAIPVVPGIHHTMGGVKIDSDAQVISIQDQSIPGLFAAGEVTGGVHGSNRLGGNAVTDFVVFGRIAGANAAAYARKG